MSVTSNHQVIPGKVSKILQRSAAAREAVFSLLVPGAGTGGLFGAANNRETLDLEVSQNHFGGIGMERLHRGHPARAFTQFCFLPLWTQSFVCSTKSSDVLGQVVPGTLTRDELVEGLRMLGGKSGDTVHEIVRRTSFSGMSLVSGGRRESQTSIVDSINEGSDA
jgi:hypothetical protein